MLWKVQYDNGQKEDLHWRELLDALVVDPRLHTENSISISSSTIGEMTTLASDRALNMPHSIQHISKKHSANEGISKWWTPRKHMRKWYSIRHKEFKLAIGNEVTSKSRLISTTQQLWVELSDIWVDDGGNFDDVLKKFSSGGDIRAGLQQMNSKGTSGMSGVTVAHLKCCSDDFLETLLPVTDAYFDGWPPPQLLHGVVVGLRKDDRRFRPVTLLDVVHKLVTSSVNRRLLAALHNSKVMKADQFGNVIGGSTNTPLRAV